MLANREVLASIVRSLQLLFEIDLSFSHSWMNRSCFSVHDSIQFKYLTTAELQEYAQKTVEHLAISLGPNLEDFTELLAEDAFIGDGFEGTEFTSSKKHYESDGNNECVLGCDPQKRSSSLVILSTIFAMKKTRVSSYLPDAFIFIEKVKKSAFINDSSLDLSEVTFHVHLLHFLVIITKYIGDTAIHQAIFSVYRATSEYHHPLLRALSTVLLQSLSLNVDLPCCSSQAISSFVQALPNNVDSKVSLFLSEHKPKIVDCIIRAVRKDLSIDSIQISSSAFRTWWADDSSEIECLDNDVFLIVEVVDSILFCFDRDQRQPPSLILALLNMFEAVFECLLVLKRVNCVNNRIDSAQKSPISWKQELLLEFGINNQKQEMGNRLTDEDKCNATPKEWFENYHNNAQVEDENTCQHSSPGKDSILDTNIARLCNLILSRCTFLLSSEVLKVQCAACCAITKGFSVLNYLRLGVEMVRTFSTP